MCETIGSEHARAVVHMHRERKRGLEEGHRRGGFNGGGSARAQQGFGTDINVINIQLSYKNSIETLRYNQIKYKDLKDKLYATYLELLDSLHCGFVSQE